MDPARDMGDTMQKSIREQEKQMKDRERRRSRRMSFRKGGSIREWNTHRRLDTQRRGRRALAVVGIALAIGTGGGCIVAPPRTAEIVVESEYLTYTTLHNHAGQRGTTTWGKTHRYYVSEGEYVVQVHGDCGDVVRVGAAIPFSVSELSGIRSVYPPVRVSNLCERGN